MPNLSVVLVLALFSHSCFGAVASHSHGSHAHTAEREEDGSYRARDADHYSDERHNTEFDHEAILGSVKEAEEFDQLSPEESQRRLGLMLPKMDLNGDNNIDRQELKKWIMQSFVKLSLEEAEERMEDSDSNRDGYVTWSEYLSDAFGVSSEDEVSPDEVGDTGMLLKEEKEMFLAADGNGDHKLDIKEFARFSNPEEYVEMHGFLVKQTLREKDKNKDAAIDFQEYVGTQGEDHSKEWLISEKEKFDDLDSNHDGKLNDAEIKRWMVPDNEEIASEEVDHLFAAADDDHDDLLSFDEITLHFDVFVGSEATDYGSDLLGNHLADEL